jgi:hypothetical protein
VSGLNPGGSRNSNGQRRVFTASEVQRVCRQAKIAEVDKPSGSIAAMPHSNSREVQRRLRQAAKRERS